MSPCFAHHLLPPCARVASRHIPPALPALYPDEWTALARASAKRVAEFAAGRACAREALRRLGWDAGPLPVGVRGEPIWPAGIVGSISHTDGLYAAAVARRSDVVALGIDVECGEPLDAALAAQIATPDERAHFAGLQPFDPGRWAKLAFSAKESVYKACADAIACPRDFHEVSIRFEPHARTFVATAPLDGVARLRGRVHLQGRFHVDGRYVCTAVVIDQPECCGSHAD